MIITLLHCKTITAIYYWYCLKRICSDFFIYLINIPICPNMVFRFFSFSFFALSSNKQILNVDIIIVIQRWRYGAFQYSYTFEWFNETLRRSLTELEFQWRSMSLKVYWISMFQIIKRLFKIVNDQWIGWFRALYFVFW